MKFWINPTDVGRHHDNNEDRRDLVCDNIDDHGFDWQIWAVAGSGFLTDSYNLFATNVILPSLAFVYWSDNNSTDYETSINAITLTGSLLGQLIFGYLADKYGRRKLYGFELIVVIFGTLGLVQCSAGYNNSTMSILSWIMFWRFFVGLGIGAEYPLSAVITAEFAPRRSRGRMMASVFLMQPLGQLFASMTGLAVLLTVGKSNNLDTITDPVAQAKIVDRIWRWVIGVGAIPAFIAIAARLTIPESPRYTLDVDQDGARALRDTRRYYGVSSPDITEQNGNTTGVEMSLANGIQAVPKATTINDDNSDDEIHDIEEPAVMYEQTVADARESMPDPFSRTELVRFFWTEGNGKYLAGTSICWFLLDFAFYGLGINNPRTIAQIWASRPAAVSHANGTAIVVPDWANPADPDMGIYDVLYNDGIRSIITVSVGSMLGSIILVKVINYVSRRSWLAWSFVGMSILFAVVGGSYFTAVNSDLHALTITLYVLCQLLFNLGPNTLTFIIPAEIFPTRYRATCHGISAAAGKLGSVVVQAMLSTPAISNAPTSKSLGWILVAFSPLMMAGAFFAWAWTPEVQDGRGSEEDIGRERAEGIKGLRRLGGRQFELPNKSLEELAKGRLGVMDAERGVGFRVKGRALGARFTDAVRRRRG